MKIAIPVMNKEICPHFGHCQEFAVAEVEDEKIINMEYIIPPPHEPGIIPQWLNENCVDMIIAGGMGSRAQQFFNQFGIKVVAGVQKGTAEEIIKKYFDGNLETGFNTCDH